MDDKQIEKARADLIRAEVDLEKAEARLRRVRALYSVADAKRQVSAARGRVEVAQAELDGTYLDRFEALSDEDVLKRYKSACAGAYEAMMGDYSIETINHSTREVRYLEEVLDKRGLPAVR